MRILVLSIFIALACVIYVAPFSHAQTQESITPAPQSPIVTVPGTPAAVNPEMPSQSAVSVKEVQSPASPSHYTDAAIWGIMVSFLIEYLKNKSWFTFLTPTSTARLKAQFGFVAALLTAAGIHFAVTGSVLDGGGAAITISGLSLDAFKDIAWQWAAQQGAYNVIIKNNL